MRQLRGIIVSRFYFSAQERKKTKKTKNNVCFITSVLACLLIIAGITISGVYFGVLSRQRVRLLNYLTQSLLNRNVRQPNFGHVRPAKS